MQCYRQHGLQSKGIEKLRKELSKGQWVFQWKDYCLVDRLLIIGIHTNETVWGADITQEQKPEAIKILFRAIMEPKFFLFSWFLANSLQKICLLAVYNHEMSLIWKISASRRYHSKANGIRNIKCIPLSWRILIFISLIIKLHVLHIAALNIQNIFPQAVQTKIFPSIFTLYWRNNASPI